MKLSAAESAHMFGIWFAELSEHPEIRSVENGAIKLDSIKSERSAVHALDGALVQVWYKAANEPSARAIREASLATQVLNLPRQMYTGRLIDIKKGGDGTIYFMVMAAERRDERRDGLPAFRCFNPSKGQLLEMTINPAAAELVAPQHTAGMQAAQAVAPSPVPLVQVPAGMAVRRSQED